MRSKNLQIRLTLSTCALCLLALWTQPAWSLEQNRALTQYMHRVWQSQQGLPLASIRTLYQTHDGYLWLGTERGLFRFDGVRFTSASAISDRIPEDISVAALLEDAQHTLWIATGNSGIWVLRDGAAFRVRPKSGPAAENVTCLISDARTNVWACTAAGPFEVHGATASYLGAATALPGNAALAATATADGKLWFAGQGPRVHIWDGRSLVPHLIRSLPAPAIVQTMLAARDGSVWLGTSDGLVQVRNGAEKRYTASTGLPGNSILSLAESQDGTLWIGTAAGFSRLRKGELESYTTKAGLSQSTIYSIFEDQQGSLWVGTKRGLNQFLDRHTVPFTTSEGLPSNDTGPVFQDTKGNVWVGTIGAGLARYQGRKLSVLTTASGLASDSIHALSGDASGDLWVGTDRGVNRLSQGRPAETLTVRSGLPSNFINSLYSAPNGALWIGTSRGLARYRDGLVLSAVERTAGSPVLSIESDRQGHIFAAIEGVGVSVFDEETLRELPRQQISIRNAVSLYQEGSELWVGTLGGGLYLLNQGRLTEFLPKDGLFDDEIFGITTDDGGLLWMACSKGIFSVKRDDLRRFSAGEIRTVVSTPYSPLDGLQTVECKSGVQPAVWHMRDGHILFSTIRGLLLMEPAQPAWQPTAPRAILEAVIVNGRTETAGGISSISRGTKNVDFVYTGLDLRSPGRVTFRYILEGFNRDWVDAGARREASFTNLQPGRYRFRLKACATAADCTEVVGPELVIPARIYQQPWFPYLCGGIVLATAWLTYLSRIRRLKHHFAVILAERTRIARELHDTLLQGFSGVTMEMQALAQRLPSDSKAVLSDIIADAANCLRDVRYLLTSLRNEQARRSGMAAAIARTASQVSGGAAQRLKLDLEPVPAELPAHAEYNLTRIVQEAVTNAMNHSGAARITVALRSTAKRVLLSVTDNGCGFITDRGVEGHFGLLGMKERAAEIGANLNISSCPGEGTSITVEFPASRNGNSLRNARTETREPSKALPGLIDG